MIQIEKIKQQKAIYDTLPSHLQAQLNKMSKAEIEEAFTTFLEFREKKLLLKLIKPPIIVPLMIQ